MTLKGMATQNLLGAIVIGRNEGDRLRKCLSSVVKIASHVVYVDSGSTDSSVSMARGLGVAVVELDLSIPFTAARARNEGARRIFELAPDVPYIQFVDGDCEVINGWAEIALRFLESRPDIAVVCGRRRERHPDHSIYNLMCDIEWNTPVGNAKACGGDAMMRADAFVASGGYRETLIAGEEPELCLRLRQVGWKIWRIDADMVWHDAAIFRFSQWWRRAMRGGHAYAEGSYLHRSSPERYWVRETRRSWLWGLVIPVAALVTSLNCGLCGLLLCLMYPLQIAKLWFRERGSSPVPLMRAFFLVLAKFPEVLGQIRFMYGRFAGKRTKLIEYK